MLIMAATETACAPPIAHHLPHHIGGDTLTGADLLRGKYVKIGGICGQINDNYG
jgi:hypothetical protein